MTETKTIPILNYRYPEYKTLNPGDEIRVLIDSRPGETFTMKVLTPDAIQIDSDENFETHDINRLNIRRAGPNEAPINWEPTNPPPSKT